MFEYIKIINLLLGYYNNFFPKNVGCKGRGIYQSSDSKISRPSECFTINRMHLNFADF